MRLGDFDPTVCSDQQIRKGHLTLVISIYCRTHISFKLDDIASSYASRGKAHSKISSCMGSAARDLWVNQRVSHILGQSGRRMHIPDFLPITRFCFIPKKSIKFPTHTGASW